MIVITITDGRLEVFTETGEPVAVWIGKDGNENTELLSSTTLKKAQDKNDLLYDEDTDAKIWQAIDRVQWTRDHCMTINHLTV